MNLAKKSQIPINNDINNQREGKISEDAYLGSPFVKCTIQSIEKLKNRYSKMNILSLFCADPMVDIDLFRAFQLFFDTINFHVIQPLYIDEYNDALKLVTCNRTQTFTLLKDNLENFTSKIQYNIIFLYSVVRSNMLYTDLYNKIFSLIKDGGFILCYLCTDNYINQFRVSLSTYFQTINPDTHVVESKEFIDPLKKNNNNVSMNSNTISNLSSTTSIYDSKSSIPSINSSTTYTIPTSITESTFISNINPITTNNPMNTNNIQNKNPCTINYGKHNHMFTKDDFEKYLNTRQAYFTQYSLTCYMSKLSFIKRTNDSNMFLSELLNINLSTVSDTLYNNVLNDLFALCPTLSNNIITFTQSVYIVFKKGPISDLFYRYNTITLELSNSLFYDDDVHNVVNLLQNMNSYPIPPDICATNESLSFDEKYEDEDILSVNDTLPNNLNTSMNGNIPIFLDTDDNIKLNTSIHDYRIPNMSNDDKHSVITNDHSNDKTFGLQTSRRTSISLCPYDLNTSISSAYFSDSSISYPTSEHFSILSSSHIFTFPEPSQNVMIPNTSIIPEERNYDFQNVSNTSTIEIDSENIHTNNLSTTMNSTSSTDIMSPPLNSLPTNITTTTNTNKYTTDKEQTLLTFPSVFLSLTSMSSSTNPGTLSTPSPMPSSPYFSSSSPLPLYNDSHYYSTHITSHIIDNYMDTMLANRYIKNMNKLKGQNEDIPFINKNYENWLANLNNFRQTTIPKEQQIVVQPPSNDMDKHVKAIFYNNYAQYTLPSYIQLTDFLSIYHHHQRAKEL